MSPARAALLNEPGLKEDKGLVRGAAGMMATGFLATFLSWSCVLILGF
jgi:hypothetical protein